MHRVSIKPPTGFITAAQEAETRFRSRSYRLPLASAAATANLISATENGFEITSLTSASRPEARSRLIGEAGHQQDRQAPGSRARWRAPAQIPSITGILMSARRRSNRPALRVAGYPGPGPRRRWPRSRGRLP